MDQNDIIITCTINGKAQKILAKKSWTLLYVIREVLGLKGTKYGCGTGDCGACKILLDGKPANSCTLNAQKANNREIITIEGVQEKGKLSIIQQAFVDAGAIQCGFCTPGMIITTTALLQKIQNPSEIEIRKAFDNNLCRCTGYVKIIEAVQLAKARITEIKKQQQLLQEVRGE